jgi:hypothetical protein
MFAMGISLVVEKIGVAITVLKPQALRLDPHKFPWLVEPQPLSY